MVPEINVDHSLCICSWEHLKKHGSRRSLYQKAKCVPDSWFKVLAIFELFFPSCELLFTTGLANGDPCGSVLLVRFRCVVKTTKFAKIQKPYRRRVRPRNMPLWCWGMIVGHPPSSWPRLRFGPSRRALVGKTPPRDTTRTYVKKILYYEQEKIYSMEKAGWSPS